jgi:rare lipoprotein A
MRAALLALSALTLAACAGGPRPLDAGSAGAPTPRYAGYKVGKPYQVRGVWYYPQEQPNYDEIGIASWYGEQFHNKYTADGEVFDMGMASAAHKTLPLPSLVEVTNLANGRTVIVRVNDRGPFVDGRVIDMSKAAAAELGFVAAGVTQVRVRYVGKAPAPPEPRQYQASNDKQPSLPKPGLKLPTPNVQVASLLAPPPLAPIVAPIAAPSLSPSISPPPARAAAPPPPVVAPSAPSMMASAAPAVGAASLVPVPAATGAVPAAIAQTALTPIAQSGTPSYVSAAPPAAAAAPVDDVSALLASAGASPAAGSPGGIYELQAGVFASRVNAEALAAKLGDVGLPEIQTMQRAGQTLYRVMVHGFSTPAAAAAARSQATALGVPDARIITGS